MVYLLSESHLSNHTFVDEGKNTLDLFTCNICLEDGHIKRMICDFFGVSFLNLHMNYFTRGS
jgi:S-adenosylmethionine/arginine decarboxylase-like enzyme